MRAAPGIGFFYSSNKSFNASGDRRVFRGGTFSLQFAIGGTVGRHVAMGGSYFRDQVWGLSSEDGVIDGDEPNLDDVSMTLHSTGYFVDFYLGPESGTHVQLMLGFARLSTHQAGGSINQDPFGLIGHLGVGHEVWVTKDLLVGGLGALSYAHLSIDEGQGGQTLRTLVPALYATLSMN